MIFTIFGSIIYILFFIVIPGIGAITTRRRWSTFRNLIFKYSKVSKLEYGNLTQGKMYSFRGKLESFKNDDIVWLKGESLSVCVDLKQQNLYSLSQSNDFLVKSLWKDISSIVEGTQFFVFGTLNLMNGVPYLSSSEDYKLLVVVCESSKNIFDMLLSKGRVKNEMWNTSSPYSYITGVLILIILSYFSYKTSFNKIYSFYLLLIAGTPFYFILPPGLIFYLKFRKVWDISVRFSVLSDLKKLKENYIAGQVFKIKSKSREKLSLLYYVLGYLLNLTIAGFILLKLYQVIIFN